MSVDKAEKGGFSLDGIAFITLMCSRHPTADLNIEVGLIIAPLS